MLDRHDSGSLMGLHRFRAGCSSVALLSPVHQGVSRRVARSLDRPAHAAANIRLSPRPEAISIFVGLVSVVPASFAVMGIKGRLGMVALGFAALGVMTGCEPAPPAATAPATPANLVSNAQYDVIAVGMSLEDVEWALGKRLTLSSDSTSQYSFGTVISRRYKYESDYLDCDQTVSFGFTNRDNSVIRPLFLESKSRYEYDCSGIVK